jgi:formate/nitrite transporter FocA (FNT family)
MARRLNGASRMSAIPTRPAVERSESPGETRASDEPGISAREVDEVEERSSPRTPVIYTIVCRLGEEEMARPVISLWWSGVAAGLSISFSPLAQAILQAHLPDAPWRMLISNLGYSVGFVMVVLSRQQLFTENTVTAVLPLMAAPSVANFWKLLRMWSVVLAANLAGTFFAALFCTLTPVLTPELKAAMLEISRHITQHGWLEMFFMAISAGFLIATMVWLIPSAEGAQFYVVVLMTYLIAVGGFMHIVAGSVEAFLLVLNGEMGWWTATTAFTAPVLAGNIVGGTALFTLVAHAQVMKEI